MADYETVGKKKKSASQTTEKKDESSKETPFWKDTEKLYLICGASGVWAAFRMIFLFGLWPIEGFVLSLPFFYTAFFSKKGKGPLVGVGLLMLLLTIVPDISILPQSFRVPKGTLFQEDVQGGQGTEEHPTTRGEAQGDGAENASWSHTFGSTALIAFISPLEGQTEEQIESRTVILPGQGLVSVGVEGAYTYNSTDGNMLIDPAGGVVTLHGAVSQNQPTKNQDKFPAPQFNWGEMLYRPASPEQEWNEGWNPVRGSVQLEAGKPYEFALNINQSNLTYFSVNGLTLK